MTRPSSTCLRGTNCNVPDLGVVSYSARFHVVGVECLRFVLGVEDIDVRRMNGVRPEDADSFWISGPGSENRTRLLIRLGVAGGVDTLCREIVFWELLPDRAELTLLRLLLRTAIGLSSSIVSEWLSRSAIMQYIAG